MKKEGNQASDKDADKCFLKATRLLASLALLKISLSLFFLNDTGTFYLLFTKGSPAKFIRDKGCSLAPRAKISLLLLTLVPSSFGG